MPAMFDSSVRVVEIKIGPDILVERGGQLRRIRIIVEFQRHRPDRGSGYGDSQRAGNWTERPDDKDG